MQSFKFGVIFLLLSCAILFCQNSMAEVFTIGAIYPPDEKFSNGLFLIKSLVAQANEDGLDVRLLEFVNKDNTSSGAFDLAKKAAKFRVDAIVCGGSSDQSLVVSKIANEAKIPFLAPVAIHPDVSNGKPYAVTILPNADKVGAMLADYISQTVINPKKFTIVRNLSSKYAAYNSNVVARLLKSKYPSGSINFVDIIDGYECLECILKSVQQIRPDVLYLPLSSDQNASFLIRLAQNPLHVYVIMNGRSSVLNEVNYYHLILKSTPEIVPHVFTLWAGNISGPYSSEYKKVMSGKYYSDFRTVMTFDATELLLSTLYRDPNLRGIDLVKKIKSRKFQGITGLFWYDAKGNVVRNDKNMFFVI